MSIANLFEINLDSVYAKNVTSFDSVRTNRVDVTDPQPLLIANEVATELRLGNDTNPIDVYINGSIYTTGSKGDKGDTGSKGDTGGFTAQTSVSTVAPYTGASFGNAIIKYVITGNTITLTVSSFSWTGVSATTMDLTLPSELAATSTFNFCYYATTGGVTAASQGAYLFLGAPTLRLYYGTTGNFNDTGTSSASGFSITYCKFGF